MTELVVGKYKFYPYEFDKDKTRDLEELKKLLKRAKAEDDANTSRKKAGERRLPRK